MTEENHRNKVQREDERKGDSGDPSYHDDDGHERIKIMIMISCTLCTLLKIHWHTRKTIDR